MELKKDYYCFDLFFLYFGIKITYPQKFINVYLAFGGVNKIKSKFICIFKKKMLLI
jgi:hypothetical protein